MTTHRVYEVIQRNIKSQTRFLHCINSYNKFLEHWHINTDLMDSNRFNEIDYQHQYFWKHYTLDIYNSLVREELKTKDIFKAGETIDIWSIQMKEELDYINT